MNTSLSVCFKAAQSPLAAKTIEILARELLERGKIQLSTAAPGKEADLILTIDPTIGCEGFRISYTDSTCHISGNDERGVLYGVGKYLRTARFPEAGGIKQGLWSGTEIPSKPVRGIYFATHFGNWYHTAPIAQIARYVEELALWGCNSLCVWFDMHHYTGIDDPAARIMINRLHAILEAANNAGMGAALLMLANEAYKTSPAELRAIPFPDHYHVEICPSKPEGLALILHWRKELLQAFSSIKLDFIGIWPYDQGGCKCSDCAPWGGNGFVRTAQEVAQIAREIFPAAKTFISTWEFGYWSGDQEWDMFYDAVRNKPDWADYIMAEGHGDFPPYVLQHGAPGGLPMLNFPEISMRGMSPWGGYGANLQPARLQKVWTACKAMLAGGFPYSEGIFEDINKIICLQFYWNPEKLACDTLREYAAYEFSPTFADALTEAALAMETGMAHSLEGKWLTLVPESSFPDTPLYRLSNTTHAAATFNAVNTAEKSLGNRAKGSWRWRLFWLRAALDAELAASAGKPTTQSECYFEEIRKIIHVTDGVTILGVSAPSVAFLQTLVAKNQARSR